MSGWQGWRHAWAGYWELVRTLAYALRAVRYTGRWPMRKRVAQALHVTMNAVAWHWMPPGTPALSRPPGFPGWLWSLNDKAAAGYVRWWARGGHRR